MFEDVLSPLDAAKIGIHPSRVHVLEDRVLILDTERGQCPLVQLYRWSHRCTFTWLHVSTNYREFSRPSYVQVNAQEVVIPAGSVAYAWLRPQLQEFVLWNGVRWREFRDDVERRALTDLYYEKGWIYDLPRPLQCGHARPEMGAR